MHLVGGGIIAPSRKRSVGSLKLIAECRKRTVRSVAKLVGCSTGEISMLCSARREPSNRIALAIERNLGIEPLTWTEDRETYAARMAEYEEAYEALKAAADRQMARAKFEEAVVMMHRAASRGDEEGEMAKRALRAMLDE
jgi:transcriptional regulator with XRE-family HTH domain